MEIKADAAKYLRELSFVLNQIPREMLLLLKTNDLLRGIETCLQTRNSSSSFISMSKCCVKLINSYEREMKLQEYKKSQQGIVKNSGLNLNIISLIKFDIFSYLRENFNLLKIFSYEIFLYLFNI